MLKKNTPTRLKFFVLLSLAVLLIAGGVLAYNVQHKKSADNKAAQKTKLLHPIDYTQAKPGDNTANENRKGSTGAASKDGTSSSTLNSPASPPTFSVTVSRANGSSQSIIAAANVNGSTTGTCVFKFSKTAGGNPEASSQPEQVQPSNQSAMCPPVTIQMPSKGQWYVSVSVTNNGSTVTSDWAANPVSL